MRYMALDAGRFSGLWRRYAGYPGVRFSGSDLAAFGPEADDQCAELPVRYRPSVREPREGWSLRSKTGQQLPGVRPSEIPWGGRAPRCVATDARIRYASRARHRVALDL